MMHTIYWVPFRCFIMRHRIWVCVLALFLTTSVSAQNETDIKISSGGYGLVKTNIAISYDHPWGPVTDGFSARVSYEFIKKRHITLSGNLRYNSVSTNFSKSDIGNVLDPEEINLNGRHAMGSIGLTATANTILFGKPLIGLGMINSEWGKGGFNRISATIMAILMIRANNTTQFGIGVLGLINTTSKVPVFPVFMYRHKFNEQWRLNIYGGMFGMEYTPTKNDLVSIGADIDVKSFYFKQPLNELPRTCRYTQTNFRPMMKYRRKIIPNLYLDAQAGYSINMSTRINGVNGTKEYIKISQNPHPFVLLSASYSL